MNNVHNIQNGADGAQAKGVFHFKQFREGKLLDAWDSENIVVDEGLVHYHSSTLRDGVKEANWFVGITKGTHTPVASDIAANYETTADEIPSTSYTESTRQAWSPDAASGTNSVDTKITNAASPATYNITTTVDINGAFLISNNTVNGTTGVLMAASKFGTVRNAINGDIIQVTYDITLDS